MIALLKALNVGGNNIVPMKDLAKLFEAAGALEVRTYIASGNVLFEPKGKATARAVADKVKVSLQKKFGIVSPIALRTAEELAAAFEANPFAKFDRKTRHIGFFEDVPAQSVSELDPQRSPPDQFRVIGREVHLLFPNGGGRTKLTTDFFEKKAMTALTVRNLNTVEKLIELGR